MREEEEPRWEVWRTICDGRFTKRECGSELQSV